ncbi:MAG: DeoR/GlpR family DNA-binding transcription regulator [Sedimentisphaeraceae bacterium JB056]
MGLLAENRYNYILEQLRANGRIKVCEVAKELDVTEVTIRRDLSAMQRDGILKKTYGGAVLVGPADNNIFLSTRKTKNIQAKKTIGKLAADMVHDGENIYLEAGSTCNEIIPYLADKNGLTIIVNSINLMMRLHEQPQHKVIITGGQYRPETMDMIGPAAEATIKQLGGFTAFTSADDISIDSGISGADIATVSFTKVILKRAARAIFVGTRRKFDRAALYKIADLSDLEAIITDVEPSNQWHVAAQQNNVKLIFPEDAE